MAYSTIGFKDGSTPLDATNMNKMDNQIKANADDIDSLSTDLGNLDILGSAGTEIASGTDLNDLSTPGRYTCPDSATTASCSNVPIAVSGGGFALFVILGQLANNGRRTQILINSIGDAIYFRTYNTEWRSWQQVTTTIAASLSAMGEENPLVTASMDDKDTEI